ncbi:MAG: hypothetical protein B6244_01530 [Candidatus Cloacimonetes bacterium 4572_55]|nr:MAG: hypothetical protein B6244_01530 [Candidatus Cloacimonetes bacterium 4572_55]
MKFRIKKYKLILLSTLILLSASGCVKKTPQIEELLPKFSSEAAGKREIPLLLKKRVKTPSVRIGLDTKATSLSLTCNRLYHLFDPDENWNLGKLRKWEKISLKATNNGIQVYGPKGNLAFQGLRRVFLGSEKEDTWFTVDGSRYRGFIEVIANGSSMTVINVIEIDEYLRGVVPKEIGRIVPETVEAAKAQAVAARTYTFANLGKRNKKGFDLYNTTQDQVYGGMDAEKPLIDQAVFATSGIVGLYNNQLIQSFYSSTCGGVTSNVENVWSGGKVIPYLRSVVDSPGRGDSHWFCKDSPHFKWNETWSRSQIESTLRKYLPKYSKLKSGSQLGKLRDIRIVRKDSSGRNVLLEVVTSTGRYQVKGDKIRRVLRRPGKSSILRSVYFDLHITKSGGTVSQVTARGGGNGHGVGMCQWGARGMARAGYSYEQILSHYYLGVKLTRVYNN